MQTVADACNSAAEQGLTKNKALKNGTEAKTKEFAHKGGEVSAKV